MNISDASIRNILSTHYRTRKFFINCVPCNQIPTCDRYPYAVVVNTDAAGKNGRHWIAIFVTSPTSAEYFDSIGNAPRGHIKKYLDRFPNLLTNTEMLQSRLTTVCGAHCVFFVVQRCSGRTFKEIIRTLKNTPEVDVMVFLYYYKLIGISTINF